MMTSQLSPVTSTTRTCRETGTIRHYISIIMAASECDEYNDCNWPRCEFKTQFSLDVQ